MQETSENDLELRKIRRNYGFSLAGLFRILALSKQQLETMMNALKTIEETELTFGEASSSVILSTDQQLIARVQIASGQCFEAKQMEGREETVTLVKGTGRLEIDEEKTVFSSVSLVKLTAGKVCRIFNDSNEMLEMCFVSVPSANSSDEAYVRDKGGCYEIKTGNREHIYEFFGIYGNGPSVSHSVALVEIENEGGSHSHIHPIVEETYVITDGVGRLTISGTERDVQTWDVVSIPVGEKHQISNLNAGMLQLLAIVTPPWTQDCGVYDDDKK
jgi:quercetin dioxygenase-like cupin family protein